jgi:hypothetical protein
MAVALAGCASAALLLIVSGLAKLRSPGAAAATVDQLHLPGWRRVAHLPAVRAFGLAEIGIGAAVLAAGGRAPAMLLAAIYLAFTVVVLALLRRGASSSCGCFGAADAPVSWAHLVVDVAALAAAVAVAARPADPLSAVHGAAGAVLVAQVGVLTALAYLSITALPALAAARQKALRR